MRPELLRSVGLASAGLLTCFYPLALTLAWEIWPPAATVYEVIGANYYPLPFLRMGPYFVETGFGSHLLLSFPAYALASAFASPTASHQHLWLFGVSYYTLAGLMLGTLLCVYHARSRHTPSTLCLMMIPWAPAILEPETNLNLMINYGWTQEILALATGAIFLLAHRGRMPSDRVHGLLAASLAALAVATKFSNVALFCPILAASFFVTPRPIHTSLRLGAASGALSIPLFAIATLAYNQLSLRLWIAWAERLLGFFFHEVGFTQRTPFLFSELSSWAPGSFYLPLKLLLATVLLVGIGALFQPSPRKSPRLDASRLLCLTLIVIAIGLTHMLRVRAAQGTMIDISISATLALALLLSTREDPLEPWTHRIAIGALGAVLATATASVHPLLRLQALAANSDAARGVELLVSSDAPTIYYLPDWQQPLLFPSADLLCLNKAGASADAGLTLEIHCPSATVRSPDSGLAELPHVAVIPEYTRALPESPSLAREWPEHWKPQPLDYARLDPAGRLTSSCRRFHFDEVQPMNQTLLYYSIYPMTVQVCTLS